MYNHSPTGYEWGYGGSGPAQLALAILADHLGDGRQALAIYQQFKFSVVTGLPKCRWKLTSRDIDWLAEDSQSGRKRRGCVVNDITAAVKFLFGRLVATPNALASIPNDEILDALSRHDRGDWGTLDPEDWNPTKTH